MKKLLFGICAIALFSVNTFAKNSIVKHNKVEVQLAKEIQLTKIDQKTVVITAAALLKEKESDWAGFVCWLFGGHCQPVS